MNNVVCFSVQKSVCTQEGNSCYINLVSGLLKALQTWSDGHNCAQQLMLGLVVGIPRCLFILYIEYFIYLNIKTI